MYNAPILVQATGMWPFGNVNLPEWLSIKYAGPPFEWFGPAHIGALIAVLALNLGLARLQGASPRTRTAVRWVLAIAMWAAEASWHLWTLAGGTWAINWMLPLHACSIMIWLSGFMLLTRNLRIYEFAYFMGIGGGIQYLLTPDLGPYGFPHFRFFEAFIAHGLLVTAPIYMTVVEGFRPTWRSMKRVVIGTNLYMIPIFFLNKLIGSNYLMLNNKPPTPSILDLLPPWPIYIACMEVLGLLTFLLLYLPFIIIDARSTSRSAPGSKPEGAARAR